MKYDTSVLPRPNELSLSSREINSYIFSLLGSVSQTSHNVQFLFFEPNLLLVVHYFHGVIGCAKWMKLFDIPGASIYGWRYWDISQRLDSHSSIAVGRLAKKATNLLVESCLTEKPILLCISWTRLAWWPSYGPVLGRNVGWLWVENRKRLRDPDGYRHFSIKTDLAGVRYSLACNGYTQCIPGLYMCRGMPIAQETSNRSHG